MDFQWFIDTFDDTTPLTTEFTRRELAILSSALAFLFDSGLWFDTVNYDTIEAKLADIEAKLDDD